MKRKIIYVAVVSVFATLIFTSLGYKAVVVSGEAIGADAAAVMRYYGIERVRVVR